MFEKLPLKIHLRILWKTIKTMAITFVIFWIIFHYTIGDGGPVEITPERLNAWNQWHTEHRGGKR